MQVDRATYCEDIPTEMRDGETQLSRKRRARCALYLNAHLWQLLLTINGITSGETKVSTASRRPKESQKTYVRRVSRN